MLWTFSVELTRRPLIEAKSATEARAGRRQLCTEGLRLSAPRSPRLANAGWWIDFPHAVQVSKWGLLSALFPGSVPPWMY